MHLGRLLHLMHIGYSLIILSRTLQVRNVPIPLLRLFLAFVDIRRTRFGVLEFVLHLAFRIVSLEQRTSRGREDL